VNGGREWMSVNDMPCDEITKWLEIIRTSAGYGEMHYKTYQHTDTPSIQGIWTPFTHQPHENNVMTFPNVRTIK
jgi:large subunit ribosomal protein L43